MGAHMAQTDQSVDHAVYAKGAVGAHDPHELSIDEEAWGIARRIRPLSGGEHMFHVAKLEAELRTISRNEKNGYSGWEFRRAVLQRALALLGVR
jgi:hypothetical protein